MTTIRPRRHLRVALLAALLNVLIAPAAWAVNKGGSVVSLGTDSWYIGSPGSSHNNVFLDENPDTYHGSFTVAAGGYSATTAAQDNHITIEGASTFSLAEVYGGYSTSGDATYNFVYLKGGKVNVDVVGGYAPNGNATNNTVYLQGGKVDARVLGGSCFAVACSRTTGNTLNVEGKSLEVGGVANFATINFNPAGGYAAGDTALSITGSYPINLKDVTVTVSSSMAALKVGDTITLISNSVINPPKNSSWGGFEFNIIGGALVATVKAAPSAAAAVPTLGGAGLALTALALPAFAAPALRRRRKPGKKADTDA